MPQLFKIKLSPHYAHVWIFYIPVVTTLIVFISILIPKISEVPTWGTFHSVWDDFWPYITAFNFFSSGGDLGMRLGSYIQGRVVVRPVDGDLEGGVRIVIVRESAKSSEVAIKKREVLTSVPNNSLASDQGEGYLVPCSTGRVEVVGEECDCLDVTGAQGDVQDGLRRQAADNGILEELDERLNQLRKRKRRRTA
ncbi:hypothetical protein BGZ60DRAFT_243448 [Tricladium varicosporioides]|nr:hypothetical protein BGZ60DRAFT_243448 [Hymenoscyphus varicosporioides]